MVGGTVVSLTRRSFDAHELWQNVQDHRVQMCVIVGDAFARPMVRALEEAEGRSAAYDLSSLAVIVSGGVMWTAPFKEPFLARGVGMLMDGLGSSEATGIGMSITTAGQDSATGRFMLNPGTRVLREDGRDVTPGSGEIGLLAVTGALPRGYYKDAEKSAATFREIDGVRYAFPVDWARVDTDGSITLLGRGSVCIHTGGGKGVPDESEGGSGSSAREGRTWRWSASPTIAGAKRSPPWSRSVPARVPRRRPWWRSCASGSRPTSARDTWSSSSASCGAPRARPTIVGP